MAKCLNPKQVDIAAFAKSGSLIDVTESTQDFPRLALEIPGSSAPVRWSAKGEVRAGAGSAAVPWLSVQVLAELPLRCQNCLAPVIERVQVDRWFRFAADEVAAAIEDEESEEDVLALSDRFDLRALVEDELLMALPMVPRHAQCALAPLEASGDDGLDAPTHPFAGLAVLKH